MRRGYFGENGILARLRADFGGAAAGLDGSLRETVRNLAPKRAILAAPKAVIHIIPKSAFPQKWRKKPSSYRGFGGAPTNFPPGYPPIAPRRQAQAPSPKTAPKEAKRYTLQHYIILCQPTQIKGWWGGREGLGEDGKGFAAPGGQWTKVYFLHFLRTGNAYQGQTENAPASAC